MATGGGLRFDVSREAVPVAPGVEAVCTALGVEPWHVTSCGSLLLAVAPDRADCVVAALEARGTPAAVVGTVSEGSGVYVDDECVEHPEVDPSWAAYRRLADRTD
jgi:hydrogenase expression/formation protein HypE